MRIMIRIKKTKKLEKRSLVETMIWTFLQKGEEKFGVFEIAH